MLESLPVVRAFECYTTALSISKLLSISQSMGSRRRARRECHDQDLKKSELSIFDSARTIPVPTEQVGVLQATSSECMRTY